MNNLDKNTQINKEKGTTGAVGHLYNALSSGLDYGLTKLDKLSEEVNRLMFLPATLMDKELDEEFESYMDEQSGFREELASDIRARREELDRYAEENPIKGMALRIPVSTAVRRLSRRISQLT